MPNTYIEPVYLRCLGCLYIRIFQHSLYRDSCSTKKTAEIRAYRINFIEELLYIILYCEPNKELHEINIYIPRVIIIVLYLPFTIIEPAVHTSGVQTMIV